MSGRVMFPARGAPDLKSVLGALLSVCILQVSTYLWLHTRHIERVALAAAKGRGHLLGFRGGVV